MQGIYQIRNIENNKIYIGSSMDIEQRWSGHKSELKRNKHHSFKLQEDWNKYGENKFVLEMLIEVDDETTRDELSTIEQKYIDEYNPIENGYNVALKATATKLKTHRVFGKRNDNSLRIERTVRKIGNSMGILLPSDYLKHMELTNGSIVYVSYQDGKIIIETDYVESEETSNK